MVIYIPCIKDFDDVQTYDMNISVVLFMSLDHEVNKKIKHLNNKSTH